MSLLFKLLKFGKRRILVDIIEIKKGIEVAVSVVHKILELTGNKQLAENIDEVVSLPEKIRKQLEPELNAAGLIPSPTGTMEWTDQSAEYASKAWMDYAEALKAYVNNYVTLKQTNPQAAFLNLRQANDFVGYLESATRNLIDANKRAYSESLPSIPQGPGLFGSTPTTPWYIKEMQDAILAAIADLKEFVTSPIPVTQPVVTEGVVGIEISRDDWHLASNTAYGTEGRPARALGNFQIDILFKGSSDVTGKARTATQPTNCYARITDYGSTFWLSVATNALPKQGTYPIVLSDLTLNGARVIQRLNV